MVRRFSRLALLLLVPAALLALLEPSLAAKRVALVIGNSHYNSTPALANPANDATDVAAALTAVGFEVILKLDATKRQMDQAIAQFARASAKADTSLFFYTGHGMQYQGRNFVMPVDAELEDEISLRYELTALDEIKEALQQSKGVKIMVLDACRNNPLADKLVRSIQVSTRDIPKVQGYARAEQTAGMIIVYATQADAVAYDGTGHNSPFSSAFLKEIKEPGLEIGSMFRRVAADVYAATDGQQSPEMSISLLTEYYLNQAETDQTIWARIRTSADIGAIREFLDRYPNSFYAPDAAAKLELLEHEARDKDAADQLRKRQDAAAAEAERLKQEQVERERSAAEARAREQDLATKLAAAETERQKLAAQLADRQSAEAQSERAQTERAQTLKSEVAQLEQQVAAARARADAADKKSAAEQVSKQQDAAAAAAERQKQEQTERERIAAEARKREQDLAIQLATAERDLATAEAERQDLAAKLAERQSTPAQDERQQTLKTEIGKLEQQAAEARAHAAAEEQKADVARSAASSAAQKVAAVESGANTAAPPPVSGASGVAPEPAGGANLALIGPIRDELRRLGCYAGGEEDWGAADMKRGVAKYTLYAKLASPPSTPTTALLEDLRGRHDRLCPPDCSAREIAIGGRCVAKTCGRNEILTRTGQCMARPAAPPHEVASRATATARPAAGGRCFVFNGNQYCE